MPMKLQQLTERLRMSYNHAVPQGAALLMVTHHFIGGNCDS